MSEIKHFDTIIHLDFNRSYNDEDGPEDPLFEQREQSRFRRLGCLALTPDNALIYYSSYLIGRPPFKNLKRNASAADDLAFLADEQRIKRLEKMFGDRLILLPWKFYIQASDLRPLLTDRNIQYDPNQTTQASYGEYLEVCVENYSRGTAEALGLKPENSVILKDLSLSDYSSVWKTVTNYSTPSRFSI